MQTIINVSEISSKRPQISHRGQLRGVRPQLGCVRGGGWRNDGGDGDCNGGPHARGGGGPCDASAGSNRSWPGMTEGRGRFSSGQWARERVIRGIFRKVPPSFPSFRGSKEGSIGSLAPEGPNEISVRQFEEDSWQ